MSSAETLNFGPQWLRDLSEGSGTSSTSGLSQSFQTVTKFKLAENRYGREEMLALFVEEPEVPDELNRAPSLLSEIVQVPLALRASVDHSQSQLSSSYRSRGVPAGLRGRSIPSRGRGRGRGGAWADQDDGPLRRPPLRRSESEDWRSDSLRGKGDGAENIINGLKEWRVSGQRGGGADFWKDAWRDKSDESSDQRFMRSRSLSLKEPEEGDRPWQDETLNGVHSKHSEFVNVPGKDERPKLHEAKNYPEEVAMPNSGTADEQFSIDTGGAEKVRGPLEALPEHQEDDIQKEASSGFSMPEVQSALNKLADFPSEIFKVTAEDPPDQSANVQPCTTTIQFPLPNPEPVGTRPSTFQPSSFPSVPVSSNTPMAQLQALATTWYYKDPQGDVQGPFSCSQMFEWFNAGYFTMGLLVKRACDQDFTPLGELIKRWGQVPFLSSPPKNPFTCANPVVPTISSTPHVQYSKLGQHSQHTSSQIQAPVGRMPSVAELQPILENLMKNAEFRRLSPQVQQTVVLSYAEKMNQQSIVTTATQSPNFPDVNGLRNDISPASNFQSDAVQYQKMLDEARRKEEEKIRQIRKQQEEQKELLRQQEEEFRKKKEILMMEEQEIKRLQLEAQQKKERLQREIEEDERRKKLQEIQELERKRKEEEERQKQREMERRLAEERRRQEEEERRKLEEDRRRMEEEARKEMHRQEELRKIEIQREEQRMLEEKRRQQQKDQEAMEEMQRREAARLRLAREEEARLAHKKQQQVQQAQLPHQARWAQGQPVSGKNESLSLLEIQKLEAEVEKARMEEEARMAKEYRSQAPKPRSGWGANREVSAGLSLLDIQREEAKQMSITKQNTVVIKQETTKPSNFGSSWSKPPKIQPDPPKQSKHQPSFWDQVIEENPSNSAKPTQSGQAQASQPKHQRGSKKAKGNDEQQVKAIFQQQISKDPFTEWCENYLRKMNVASIDVPTFVTFLRDVESPYEVQEYVQSYLGDSRNARDFTTLFLEERAKLSNPESFTQSKDKPRSVGNRDTDGFEVVTSNAKRKKKLRKLQKVDPSILGFSVNAASDRVNMGEIETAKD